MLTAVQKALGDYLEKQRSQFARFYFVGDGDLLEMIGSQDLLTKAVSTLGHELAPTQATDFVVLGLMIFFGGLLVVLMRFSVFGIEVSLGTSVGPLLAGLLTGQQRTRHPLPDQASSRIRSIRRRGSAAPQSN